MEPEQPGIYLDQLKAIHLFRGLDDEQILEVARNLEFEKVPADTVIFEEGEPGDSFYIIHRGQVKVTRRIKGEDQQISALVPGDFFGELSLVRAQPRSATVTSVTAVELLRLSKEDFDELLEQFPQIKLNLTVTQESRELLRKLNFDWFNEDEVAYLVARRHKFALFRNLALPLLGTLALLLAAAAMAFYNYWIFLWIWLPLALADLAAMVWFYVDWTNDFFIVTNQRVVWLEKIIALYDSRQEAPLRTILSVSAQTDLVGRSLEYGDVVVRTYTGQITFEVAPRPNQIAALVEEHWIRTRRSLEETEQEAMKDAVRVKIGLKPKGEAQAGRPAARPAPEAATGFRRTLRRILQVRFEAGNVVTYRKHWYVLFLAIGLQSAILLLLFGAVIASAVGLVGLPWATVLLVSLVVGIPVALWWLYEYIDWRNDIYQVTPDQIVDVRKRPLASEVRLAAPLENILSLEYDRLGILGPLLNFGNVIATVGVTRFIFEGVFDPVGVQRDVYRRIEMNRVRKAEAEAAKRREEIAEWLGVYHAVAGEQAEGTSGPPPPAPEPENELGFEEEPGAEDRFDYEYP